MIPDSYLDVPTGEPVLIQPIKPVTKHLRDMQNGDIEEDDDDGTITRYHAIRPDPYRAGGDPNNLMVTYDAIHPYDDEATFWRQEGFWIADTQIRIAGRVVYIIEEEPV
jgi:hypothetical protein